MTRLQRVARVVLICGLAAGTVHLAAASRNAYRATPPLKATLAVVGGYLIDGFGGPPRPNAVVLVDGDKIVAVGAEGRLAVPPGAKVIDANGYTVMPGLINTHVHLDFLGHADYRIWQPKLSEADYTEVVRLSAAQLLAHGITSVRDAGGDLRVLVDLRDRINRGEVKGPRLLVSGGWIEHWPDEQAKRHYKAKMTHNIHNPEEARQVTRKLLEGGADTIKIYLDDLHHHTGFTLEEVKAITDEVHRAGKFVGAHVHTDDAIQMAIKGGVDLLDHAGSGHQNPLFTEETLRMMALEEIPINQQIAHNLTAYQAMISWPERLDDPQLRQELGKFADDVLDSLRDFPNGATDYFQRILGRLRLAPESASQLQKAHCKIVVGTDSGTPANFHSDGVWREMEALVNLAGMTSNEAIVAATRDAAAALKLNTGLIQPGRLADIILVKGNPLDSILYVQNVEHVIKGGVQYK